MKEKLGPPMREVVELQRNPYEERKNDELHTLSFDGLVIQVYRVYDGRELLCDVLLTSATYEQASPASIGTAREDVLKALGPPRSDSDGETGYCMAKAKAGLCAYISFADERVSRIHWTFPID